AHRAGNVAGEIFGRGIALHGRKVEGAVDHHDAGGAEAFGQPIGAHEPAGGRFMRHGYRPSSNVRGSPVSGHATQTQFAPRFCLPFFSICVTRTAPISFVRCTWVPPQGCRSYPTISISRTRPLPMGGLTDMVLTRPGAASSSASVIQRERTSAPAAIIAASFLVISSLSRPASGMSKSSRPSLSPPEPPVTG